MGGRAIVVWGSTTGNTERLSEAVEAGLTAAGWQVDRRSVNAVAAAELPAYDLVVLGCSTWGYGELQEDFEDLYEELGGLSLAGRPAAVFGPGDSSYDCFCQAVDRLAERLEARGARLVAPPLKIDGEVDRHLARAAAWGQQVAEAARVSDG